MGTAEIRIGQVGSAHRLGSGALRMLSGFAVILVLGTVLLWLPISSAAGERTGFVDALFTASSAMCVTGLTLFDTGGHWGAFGEAVILVLIQLGGLGYMMGTALMLWALGRHLGIRDRHLLRLYYGAPSMGEALSFARAVAIYAAVLEGAGAIVLMCAFLVGGHGITESAWWAVFHSISAFNNAGFNVTGNDMIDYHANYAIMGTISILVIAGGLGAVPVLAAARRRSWARLPLDAKLIFVTTGMLILAGTISFAAFEWHDDETIGEERTDVRILDSFFESAMTRTAGFSAVRLDEARDETKLLLMPFMLVGGAAGSTAGGIKVGVFAIILLFVAVTAVGRKDVVVFRRKIPDGIIRQSLVIALSAVTVAISFTLLMVVLTDEPFVNVAFDSLSALGTVGLSTGVPERAGDTARLMLAGAMLVGRFGPLGLVLEMNRRRAQTSYRVPDEGIRFG